MYIPEDTRQAALGATVALDAHVIKPLRARADAADVLAAQNLNSWHASRQREEQMGEEQNEILVALEEIVNTLDITEDEEAYDTPTERVLHMLGLVRAAALGYRYQVAELMSVQSELARVSAILDQYEREREEVMPAT